MNNTTNKTLIKVLNNDECVYAGKDLWYYFKKIFFAKNVNNGYHNFRHLLHVTCEVYDAIKVMKIDSITARYMLIAAMFHDYGHLGDSKNPDSVNIAKAIAGVKAHLHPQDKNYQARIIALIQATEFPHKKVEGNMLIDVFRDADMSQSLDNVWMQQILFGMGLEQHKSHITMLKEQGPFLENFLAFKSEWGKRKFEPILAERIEEVRLISKKIFDTKYYCKIQNRQLIAV